MPSQHANYSNSNVNELRALTASRRELIQHQKSVKLVIIVVLLKFGSNKPVKEKQIAQ